MWTFFFFIHSFRSFLLQTHACILSISVYSFLVIFFFLLLFIIFNWKPAILLRIHCWMLIHQPCVCAYVLNNILLHKRSSGTYTYECLHIRLTKTKQSLDRIIILYIHDRQAFYLIVFVCIPTRTHCELNQNCRSC